jgi:site-specific recombinase XerD
MCREAVTHVTMSRYIEHLMRKRLAPKTVNCHLNGIRQFYHFLRDEEGVIITNPIKKTHLQKMSQPLPRHLRDDQVETFFKAIKGARDRAMFMLMLRCGLRVEEVAHLTIGVIDVKRRTILVEDGKAERSGCLYEP